ncbi:MAG: DUF1549 domain-containing protein, partial [Verrucomicrobiae bacterium]|nr:DUF1549 domain-containing protein [Verrucomicrobiae bacterium]
MPASRGKACFSCVSPVTFSEPQNFPKNLLKMNEYRPPFVRLIAVMAAGVTLTMAAVADSEKTALERIAKKDLDYWFFQPLGSPAVPNTNDAEAWARNDIDRFILAKLEPKGITPAKSADPRALIRRAYFDLIGLPPTIEQIETFAKAHAANPEKAFGEMIDGLLESPQ